MADDGVNTVDTEEEVVDIFDMKDGDPLALSLIHISEPTRPY